MTTVEANGVPTALILMSAGSTREHTRSCVCVKHMTGLARECWSQSWLTGKYQAFCAEFVASSNELFASSMVLCTILLA